MYKICGIQFKFVLRKIEINFIINIKQIIHYIIFTYINCIYELLINNFKGSIYLHEIL